ncbi:MAG: Minor outer membrane protein Omp16 [Verrucomicrobiales bacterium]|nr:Minor outer membrane protein Omp16 [Verrucomicrobiales bacterium]MDB6130715.1 Minor outer membrane protein Omp16 [Verrucomicrobiales bacterium]
MKRNIFKLFVIAIACATTATGCRKTVGLTHIPGQPNVVGSEATDPFKTNPSKVGNDPLSNRGNDVNNIPSNNPGNNTFNSPTRPDWASNGTPDRAALAAHTVYFALDSSIVRTAEQSKLSAVVDYLKQNSAGGIIIEGHCDERGTEGYNLALGDKRALALRDALIALGAPADRLQPKTLGETQPADSGHTEAAWSKNRRGVFVVMK